jgi:sulfur relay (sulfurtransferase) complex TusBCD TusD component (DsrE family)
MARLLLILFSPPTEAQNIDTVCELSKAAIAANHEVTIFLDADATHGILARQILPDKITSASRIAELIGMGAQVLACRESARIRGIDTKRDFINGVVESSLGGLVELMEQHDRIVAFGSGGK